MSNGSTAALTAAEEIPPSSVDDEEENETSVVEARKETLNRWIVLMVFVSAIGGFLFGYDTGVVSGSMILIRKEFQLTTFWQEIIVTVTVVAAWLSSLVAGPIADAIGRKKLVMISGVVFAVGSTLMAFSPDKTVLLCGRIVVGIGIGFSSMCVPVYLSEISPVNLRGRITVIFTLFVTAGQFIASVVCGLFSGAAQGWRWMLGLGTVPAILQFVCIIFVPESPRWLSLKQRHDEAREILQKVRSNPENIDEEMDSYRNSQSEKSTLKDLFESPNVRRALILGCLLQFYQQFAGINTVMYYSASIIAMAGIDNDAVVIWLTAVTSFCNFSFTFVGLYLVDRVGRRTLVLGSLMGVILALLSLGVSFQLVDINSPSIISDNSTYCSKFSSCSTCSRDSECGFCFNKTNENFTFCLAANHSAYNELSLDGACSTEDSGNSFAYDWCPSNHAWFAIVGLSLYLCFFAPGMGPMPWSINSEIYPNWARAKATSITTSVNWASNIFVSLSFLSLTEAITKQGTFYLYAGFATSALVVFFLILPETKGIPLEEVENVFNQPLHSLKPWKKQPNTNNSS